jgi:AraC family transcriptional regulator, ethanolamine operon transcriptional activator
MDNATGTTVTDPALRGRGRGASHQQSWRPALNPFIAGGQRFADDGVARICCTDVDELTEQVRDWKAQYVQLSPGAFAAAGIMVPLGSVLVSLATFSGSLLHRATPPAGCHSIVLQGRGSDRFLFRGRNLLEDECLMLCAGADGEAVSHGKSVIATASVSDEVWQAASHWAGECSLAMEKGARLRTPGAGWIASVLQEIEWIVEAVVEHPQHARSRDVLASMADLMLYRLFRSADTTVRARNDRHERVHRRIAVERARSFIDENLTNPIRLSDLCSHAHAQARALEYGFHEIFGMSPVSYIRTLRLNRVHHLLLSADAAQRTITEIALDCGFWHLSQFAMDYRKFFGESPSVTHRRAMNGQ